MTKKHIGVGGGVIPKAAPTSYELHETPACATRALLGAFPAFKHHRIWEPCAGRGAILRVMKVAGIDVVASDLVGHEGRDKGIATGVDFLLTTSAPSGVKGIVTNFPFAENDAC